MLQSRNPDSNLREAVTNAINQVGQPTLLIVLQESGHEDKLCSLLEELGIKECLTERQISARFRQQQSSFIFFDEQTTPSERKVILEHQNRNTDSKNHSPLLAVVVHRNNFHHLSANFPLLYKLGGPLFV